MKKDKILIIDDSTAQAEHLSSILEDDYEVAMCHTAQGGLSMAKTGVWSLILLDVVMPDMDGFMLLKELKDTEATKYIPVIMLTSLSEVQYEERGLLLGAVDYVAKPFSPVIIKARVNTHIQLYRYQRQFREQAMLDGLTGIANRRCYESGSREKWQEAMRFGLPLSICIFDIDKFKLYNDTYGHPAGDRVIISVARTVAERFRRSTDLFARYGGEEFVAVFLGSNGKTAFEFMKSVRQEIEDLHIPHNSPICDWVTVSAGGVSLTPNAQDSYEMYLKLADTMLYDAKRFGRNRVVWLNENKEQWCEK